MAVALPLAGVADAWLGDLARLTGCAMPDGATLLGERAMLGGFHVPGRRSAGGGCRLYEARGGTVALSLARDDDRALLPALFEQDDTYDEATIAARIAGCDAGGLVARGRLLGLAIAHDAEAPPPACRAMTRVAAASPPPRPPRVLDLSALWAGPLAAHLLWLAGAEVTRVESATRRDAMRDGDAGLFALLDQGKRTVVLDLRDTAGRDALLALIAASDIVIEAARPRALEQLGIRADDLVRRQPGLSWITVTGHGATGDAAHWIGFGDDCGVAGGLSAALSRAAGRTGFVGDAIADPLTGSFAARAAWRAWAAGGGARLGLAMSGIVATAIAEADPVVLARDLVGWAGARGAAFPRVPRRAMGRAC